LLRIATQLVCAAQLNWRYLFSFILFLLWCFFSFELVKYFNNVLLQCTFLSDSPSTAAKNTSAVIRRTGSVSRTSDYNIALSAAAGAAAARGSSLYLDDYADELVEDDDQDDEGNSKSSGSQNSETESEIEDDICNTEIAVSSERVFFRLPAPNLKDTEVEAPAQPNGESPNQTIKDSSTGANAQHNLKLEAGIVDYCVVLGKIFFVNSMLLFFEEIMYCFGELLY
jgi:hypothetical protein